MKGTHLSLLSVQDICRICIFGLCMYTDLFFFLIMQLNNYEKSVTDRCRKNIWVVQELKKVRVIMIATILPNFSKR